MNNPVFIIGMPRSGTKLLRELLNQHSLISIPKSESHFIPFFIKKYSKERGHETSLSIEELYDKFINTTFYRNMNLSGISLSYKDFQSGIEGSKQWNVIFKFILKYFSEDPKSKIWGDKTPGYINYISTINRIYSGAKFVHILRDPRDYCISVNKIWNKNIYRAAHVWNETITEFSNKKLSHVNLYTVKYEDLINNPHIVLTEITNWLGVEFEESMLRLDSPSENYGDAKGMLVVKKDNSKKYLTVLNETEIRRIEEITKPSLELMGYKCTYDVKHQPINRLKLLGLKLADGYSSVHFHVREKGLFAGIKYFILLHLLSSWRKQN